MRFASGFDMPKRDPGSRCPQRGFSLLEVLVAFVILALSLGVLFRGLADNLRSTRVAGQYDEALSRAQSRLNALTVPGMEVAPRVDRGEEGNGFRWEVEITPIATAVVARQRETETGGPRLSLYAARVTESWISGSGKGSVALITDLLGAPRP